MKLPDLRQLPATAKAQAWGLAVGFALALLATDRMGLSVPAFFLGFAGTWAVWETLFGLKLGARMTNTTRWIALCIALGLMLPWGGFLFAYALSALRG